MSRPLLPLLLCLVTLSAGNLSAKLFENGDFTVTGSNSSWQGDGQVVYIKPDGTITSQHQDGTTPAMEIKLNPGQFKEVTQRFTTPPNTGAIGGEITIKTSPDYKRDEKSPAFTADNTWTAGGHWFSVRPSFPKVDLILCIDKTEGYFYQLANPTIGGDWQTIPLMFANMGEVKAVKFRVIVPPGTGTLWIKNVKINYVPMDPGQLMMLKGNKKPPGSR